MSNTSQLSANSARGAERRVHYRQRITSLSYIQVGGDNGGILLNLGEGGLALTTAVGIAGDQTTQVRFRLPGSSEWIDTVVLIAWTSSSKKEAGIRFIDLRDDDRLRIKAWLAIYDAPIFQEKMQPITGLPVEGASTVGSPVVEVSRPIPPQPAPTTAASAPIAGRVAHEQFPPSPPALQQPVVAYPAYPARAQRVVAPPSAAAPTAPPQTPTSPAPAQPGATYSALASAGTPAAVRTVTHANPAPHVDPVDQRRAEAAHPDIRLASSIPAAPQRQRGPSVVLIPRSEPAEEMRAMPDFAAPAYADFPTRGPEPAASSPSVRLSYPWSEDDAAAFASYAAPTQQKMPLRLWLTAVALVSVVAIISFAVGAAAGTDVWSKIAGFFSATKTSTGNAVEGARQPLAADLNESASLPSTQAAMPPPYRSSLSPRSYSAGNGETASNGVQGLSGAATFNGSATRRTSELNAQGGQASAPRWQAPFVPSTNQVTSAPLYDAARSDSRSGQLSGAVPTTPAASAQGVDTPNSPPTLSSSPMPTGAPISSSAGAGTEHSMGATTATAIPKAISSTVQAEAQPLTKGSIEINSNPYPSVRIPAGMKSSANPGTSLQIGHVISRVEPVYPAEALRQHLEGTIKLHAMIRWDGVVDRIQVGPGPQLLVDAATSAVQQWRYTPTYIGGESVETEEDVTIAFKVISATAAR